MKIAYAVSYACPLIPGIRIKLIPTEEEIEICREFGHEMAQELMGFKTTQSDDMADLA